MRGDRKNHTRSPCRPVTHLFSHISEANAFGPAFFLLFMFEARLIRRSALEKAESHSLPQNKNLGTP